MSIRVSKNGKIELSNLDNFLITAGAGFLAFFVLAIILEIFSNGSSKGLGVYLTIFFGVLVCLCALTVGLVLRRRELKSLSLLQLTRLSSETRISTLIDNSRFTLDDIRRGVMALNTAGLTHLVLDEAGDRLYDSRLDTSTTVTYNCQGCGATSRIAMNMQTESSASCSYCHAPIAQDSIYSVRERQRQEVFIQQASILQIQQQTQLAASVPEPKLRLPVLAALTIFFWPAALIYIVHYMHSTKQYASRIDEFARAHNSLEFYRG